MKRRIACEVGLGMLALGMAASIVGLARWEGDNLGGGNNPPAQNFAVPENARNAIVRVRLAYYPGGGIEKQVLGTGVVIAMKRQPADSQEGKLCVLTGDHNTSPPPNLRDKKITLWQVGFGNGGAYTARALGRNVFRAPKPQGGNRPDLCILGLEIDKWKEQVPVTLVALPIMAQNNDMDLVQAGYGKTGQVVVADREYIIQNNAFGTLRIGTNKVDAVVNHDVPRDDRAQEAWSYKALESGMDFRPLIGAATSADSHIYDADSGGPSLQKDGDNWKVVGIHSESEAALRNGNEIYVREGHKEWDVRVAEYAAWINATCTAFMAAEVVDDGSINPMFQMFEQLDAR